MSSPPDTPKQKKGIRQLLKESSRSRSRSPSQSLPQPDPRAPSATTGLDEGIANLDRGGSLVDSATVTTYYTNISYVDASERVDGAPRIPIIVEPVDPTAVQLASDQEVPLRGDPTAIGIPSKLAPNELPESSNDALERSTTVEDVLVDTELRRAPLSSEHTPRSRGASEPEPVLPTTILPDQGRGSRNPAWNGLRRSLRFLKDSSSLFPQLSLAIESLLSCLDGLEVAVQNRQEFEDLATELTTLSESLRQHMRGSSSMLMSGSTASVAMAIERQAIVIRERPAGVSERGMRGASMDEEELVKHYRKVQSHFRQLQVDKRKHEHMENCQQKLGEHKTRRSEPLLSKLPTTPV
ncbi:unnamed protein product [Rhizoctonia solani]|uniref:Uncharacterized protein n=1 Tax=Rhizoctonia solani TaxID=456999 RepID=A0A8H3CBZ9_9AGAM|nr:unnamed protein product [Rhizoctonia solani]